jgi:hypothetical protein
MLTNYNLVETAKKMKINLVTVCSKDELHKVPHKIGGYIINLNNSNQNGSHWTSFILYYDGTIYRSLYFDTYGLPAPIEVEQYLRKLNDYKIPYNTRQIQKIYTTDCGWYCISMLFNMQYKRKYSNMLDDYQAYISKFSNNLSDDLKILKNSFLPFYRVNFYTKTVESIKHVT